MRSAIALSVIVMGLGCSIKAPEVRVTGEKTALEREVLGTYHELEEDTWMVASSRSAKGEGKANLSPEKQKVLEALQTQKFNKDDIDEFKQKGYVGEGNDGLLAVRPSRTLESDDDLRMLVQEIVQEENRGREIIMARVVELNDRLQQSRQEEIRTIFARMNHDNSPKGTWIQQTDGSWTKK